MSKSSSASAIILAAGSSSRMQGHVADKMLAPLKELPVICHSVRAFIASECVQELTIVYRDSLQREALMNATSQMDLDKESIRWVQGGDRRQDSVHKALLDQSGQHPYVFIHDGARPLLTLESIEKLHSTVVRDQAATLVHPVTDTIKRVKNSENLQVVQLEDMDRSRLWAMETPQVFALELILKAYAHIEKKDLEVTDDTAAISAIGAGTTLVLNETTNIKITHPNDLDRAEWEILRSQKMI